MANRHDIPLPPLELPASLVPSVLPLLLHTIILLRAPKTLTPSDVVEEPCVLEDLSFKKLRYPQVTATVDEAVKNLMTSPLTPVGPDLSQGSLTINFYIEQPPALSFLGLGKPTRVVFERWHLNIIVDAVPPPLTNTAAGEIELRRGRRQAEDQVRLCLGRIYDWAMKGAGGRPKEVRKKPEKTHTHIHTHTF